MIYMFKYYPTGIFKKYRLYDSRVRFMRMREPQSKNQRISRISHTRTLLIMMIIPYYMGERGVPDSYPKNSEGVMELWPNRWIFRRG